MSYHLGRDDDKGKSARHLRKETQVSDGNCDDNDDMIFIIMMILMTKVRVPDIGGGEEKYHDFDYLKIMIMTNIFAKVVWSYCDNDDNDVDGNADEL